MATTSFTLGEHWEVFMKNQIASGKYGSASELVRDGLRLLERRVFLHKGTKRDIDFLQNLL